MNCAECGANREPGNLFCRSCGKVYATPYVPDAPEVSPSAPPQAAAPAGAPLIDVAFLPISLLRSKAFRRALVGAVAAIVVVALVVTVVVPTVRSLTTTGVGQAGMAELGRQTAVYLDNANGRASGTYLGEDRVLVAAHSIIGGGSITVFSSDRNVGGASIVKLSTGSDLAVLAVPSLRNEKLRATSWGESSSAKAGETFFAISYTGSGAIAVAPVTISGTQQRGEITALQTSAQTDPIAAGGPILDATGRLVGVSNLLPRDRTDLSAVAASSARGFVDGPDRIDMPPKAVGVCVTTPGAPEHFLTPIQIEGRIRAIVNGSATGFGRRNASGRFEGLEPDLVREVARTIFGRAGDRVDDCVEFTAAVPDTRLPALLSGKVDVVVSGNSTNDLTPGLHLATNGYFTPRQHVLVRSDSPITTLSGLAGKSVCTYTATYDQNFKTANLNVARVVIEDTLANCLLALEARRVDAVTATDTNFAVNGPIAHGHRLIPEPLAAKYLSYVMVVRDRQTELATYLNQTIATLTRNGTWTKIYEQNVKPLTGVERTAP